MYLIDSENNEHCLLMTNLKEMDFIFSYVLVILENKTWLFILKGSQEFLKLNTGIGRPWDTEKQHHFHISVCFNGRKY